jgi:hypothetical protein
VEAGAAPPGGSGPFKIHVGATQGAKFAVTGDEIAHGFGATHEIEVFETCLVEAARAEALAVACVVNQDGVKMSIPLSSGRVVDRRSQRQVLQRVRFGVRYHRRGPGAGDLSGRSRGDSWGRPAQPSMWRYSAIRDECWCGSRYLCSGRGTRRLGDSRRWS